MLKIECQYLSSFCQNITSPTLLLQQAVCFSHSMNKAKITVIVFYSRQMKFKHARSWKTDTKPSLLQLWSWWRTDLTFHVRHYQRTKYDPEMKRKFGTRLWELLDDVCYTQCHAKGWAKPNRGMWLYRQIHFNFINYSIWQATWSHMTGRHNIHALFHGSGVPRRGLGGSNPPPPEIPKALQNRSKLNPIVKTVKNCWI